MRASTVLVTGGAGFVGSHLTVELARLGHFVKVLDNFSSSSRSRLQLLIEPFVDHVDIIEGDVRDRSDCKQAVAGAEYVLHHAAMASVLGSVRRPDECIEVNVLGTTNVLVEVAAAAECRRFVLASSSAVYGDSLTLSKKEDQEPDPLSPYATSKLAGELLCRNFCTICNLKTVSLRYFNIFGERQDPNGPYAAVIPKFIGAARSNERPVIFGDGEQSRDFVSVADVVKANLLACFADPELVSGKSFNIGSGRETSLNDLIALLSKIIGRKIVPEHMPARPGDIRNSLADISLARRDLSYAPTESLEDGLRSLLK